MPLNNNQKVGLQSAAARLAKLPVVRSAYSSLSVMYNDTKTSHPNLRAVCELLESRVTALGTAACDRVSPVMVQLEPQISMVNDVACRSLDWLETKFPVLHTPTEQIVASAKDKMHEIQGVVNTAAYGAVGYVSWLVGRVQQQQQGEGCTDWPLVERAIDAAGKGLESALNISEALVDQVLPPTEEDTEEVPLLEDFEAAPVRRSYPVRIVSIATKLCRRTYHMIGSRMQSVQMVQNLSWSPGLFQDLQTRWLTLMWSIQELPQYLQHQLVSALVFISQMYNFNCPPSSHQLKDNSLTAAAASADISPPHKEVFLAHPPVKPTHRVRRSKKSSVFDNGCNVEGCGR